MKTKLDNNRAAYLHDKRKYGDNQSWTIQINDRLIECEARRNMNEVWCGYVYYQDVEINEDDYVVHGGITYGDNKKIGFDTNHYNDFSPHYEYGETYRTFEYVKAECEKLAQQIFI